MDRFNPLHFMHHGHDIHGLRSALFILGSLGTNSRPPMRYYLLRRLETVEETGIHSIVRSRFDQRKEGAGFEGRKGEGSC